MKASCFLKDLGVRMKVGNLKNLPAPLPTIKNDQPLMLVSELQFLTNKEMGVVKEMGGKMAARW